MLEPNTQAGHLLDNRPRLPYHDALPIPLTQAIIHPLVSLSRPIFRRSAPRLFRDYFYKPTDQRTSGKEEIIKGDFGLLIEENDDIG